MYLLLRFCCELPAVNGAQNGQCALWWGGTEGPFLNFSFSRSSTSEVYLPLPPFPQHALPAPRTEHRCVLWTFALNACKVSNHTPGVYLSSTSVSPAVRSGTSAQQMPLNELPLLCNHPEVADLHNETFPCQSLRVNGRPFSTALCDSCADQ